MVVVGIVNLLGSLDEKIENNERISQELMKLAQATFKSWFADCSKFGGRVPSDWIADTLGKYVDIKRGGSPRPIQDFLSEYGLRWLKISDVTHLKSPFVFNIKEHINESGLNKTVLLKEGSLVLSNSATPGIPRILCVDTCIHDGWLYFPRSHFSNEFLFLLFQHIRPELVNLGNGSVFTNLKTEILKNYSIYIPDKKTLTSFDALATPLFKQVKKLQTENQKLIELKKLYLKKFFC